MAASAARGQPPRRPGCSAGQAALARQPLFMQQGLGFSLQGWVGQGNSPQLPTWEPATPALLSPLSTRLPPHIPQTEASQSQAQTNLPSPGHLMGCCQPHFPGEQTKVQRGKVPSLGLFPPWRIGKQDPAQRMWKVLHSSMTSTEHRLQECSLVSSSPGIKSPLISLLSSWELPEDLLTPVVLVTLVQVTMPP